jgi:hypothetical protein
MAVLDGDTGTQIGHTSVELPGPQAYPAIVYSVENGGQPVSRAVIITYTADNQGRLTTTLTTIDLLTGDDVNTLVVQGRSPDEAHAVQYSEDGSQAYLITETPPPAANLAGTTSVTLITQGTAVAVTPTQVNGFTGQFNSLVIDPNTPDRALLFTTDTIKGTTTHVAIIDTNAATQIGPAINLAGQPADTAVIWSDDGDPTPQATLITTGLDKTGATITTLTTIDLAAGTTKT